MSFIWPAMFVLLLLIPLCVVLYIRMQRRRRRLAARLRQLRAGSAGHRSPAGRAPPYSDHPLSDRPDDSHRRCWRDRRRW